MRLMDGNGLVSVSMLPTKQKMLALTPNECNKVVCNPQDAGRGDSLTLFILHPLNLVNPAENKKSSNLQYIVTYVTNYIPFTHCVM